MNYNSLCKHILKINSKIRYAGIYNMENGRITDKMQDGITSLLDKEETQKSLVQSYLRWKIRQPNSEIMGELIYSTARYAKVMRITLTASASSLLMISTEPELEPNEIMDDVMKLIVRHADDPNYDPYKPRFEIEKQIKQSNSFGGENTFKESSSSESSIF